MTKLTFSQLRDKFYQHNRENNVTMQYGDDKPLHGVIVYKSESWPGTNYSLESRSYRFRSDNKHFVPGMMGNSIFAASLDGSDKGVRLDWYFGEWKIDYCYIEEE